MKGKKLAIYISFALLIIVLSFVIYYGFTDAQKTDMQNVAFSFIIISEIIFFSMIYFVTRDKNNTFLKSGVISTSAVYIVALFILNIFLKTIFSTVRILVATNIILLILYIGVVLLIYLAKKEN